MRVGLIASMGNDLTVVNAARLSFGATSTELNEKDIKLIEYLAKHKHTSPFRHVMFQLNVEAPEFVARQWYKHVVGANFNDSGWNEVSQRYTERHMFHFPDEFRKQSANNKQGSDPNEKLSKVAQETAQLVYLDACNGATYAYDKLLALGVAREMARMVLPLSVYTEFVWTASLQAVVHFCKLRNHEGAQMEIQDYADAVEELCRPLVPHSWESLWRHL